MSRRSLALLTLFLPTPAACVIGPTNGEVVSQNVDTHQLDVVGFTTVALRRVQFEALSPPEQDPFAVDSTWVEIGPEIQASSAPLGYFGYNNLFLWSATLDMAEIKAELEDEIWVPGGLLRMRAREVESNSLLVTFDDVQCLLDHAGEPVLDVVQACASSDLPITTVLSDQSVGQAQTGYMVRKKNDLQEGPYAPSQEQLADDYYESLGATEAVPLLYGDWQDAHHLDDPDVVEARYFNGSDLALGRHMRCRHVRACEEGEVCEGVPSACDEILRTVCAVTNYGEPGGDAHDAFQAMSANLAFATVAMEKHYHDPDLTTCSATLASPVPAQNDVRFFAFGHGDSPPSELDPYADAAALDPEQDALAMPGMCLNCHGGNVVPQLLGPPVIVGAKFLPFDIDAFDYDASAGAGVNPEAFRQLNEIVLDTELEGAPDTAASSTIANLIIHWYGGLEPDPEDPEVDVALVRSTGTFDDDVPPEGWEGEERIYNEVVAPYCRLCHAAFDGQSFTFDTFANFDLAGNLPLDRVCNDHQMPHSRVTFQNLWSSKARMVLVNELGWLDDCAPTVFGP